MHIMHIGARGVGASLKTNALFSSRKEGVNRV